MADPVKLSAVFGLPPEAAIRYFRSKGYAISWDWHDVREQTHARAFTVAKVTEMDVLTTIRGEVERAMREGTTFHEFKKTLTPRLQALGWWGRKESLDLDTGEIRKEQLGSPRRLETIYRSNLQSAYMAGRHDSMAANAKHRPYWLYRAVGDSRTRPDHQALDGAIFKHDDPIWKNIWPPNGFGCRCTVRALTQREIDRDGLTVTDSKKYTAHWTSEDRNGNEFDRTSVRLPGMQRAFSTDPGWNGNQAMLAKDGSGGLTPWALGKAATAPPPIAAVAGSDILGKRNAVKELNDAYNKWATALDLRKTTGACFPVYTIPPAAIAALAGEKIIPPSAVIHAQDRQIAHGRRVDKKNPLPAEFWQNLPARTSETEAILLDLATVGTATPTLFLVSEGSGDGKKKVVVDINYRVQVADDLGKRRKTPMNIIITGGEIKDKKTLEDSRAYKLIWGKIK